MTTPEAVAAPAPYSPEPTSAGPRSRRMGVIAISAGLGLLVLSLLASVLMGVAAAPFAEIGPQGFNLYLNTASGDPTEVRLAALTSAHGLLGTLIGVSVIVLGITAIASGRGRAFGVVALVAAVLAPGLSVLTYFFTAFGVASA